MKTSKTEARGVSSVLFDVALKVRPGAFAENAALLLDFMKAAAKAGNAEIVVPADFIRGGDCGSLNDHPAFQVALAAAQVVSGMNYCIVCETAAVYPGAESGYALVYIYAALDGSAELLDIEDFIRQV